MAACADQSLALGARGEQLAAGFLRSRGLVVLHRGYRCRRGEIDLVCRDGDTLVFVEVKTRRGLRAGYPEEALTWQKRQRIARVARHFIAEHGLHRVPVRFDVVAIYWGWDDSRSGPQIKHYVNAFGVDTA